MQYNARRMIQLVGGKALVIPATGWTASTFAAHGLAMLITLRRVSAVVMAKGARRLAGDLRTFLDDQVDEVISRALSRAQGRHSLKADVTLDVAHGHVWEQAINEVFGDAGVKAREVVKPSITSTTAQGYSKTGLLLGQDTAADVSKHLAPRVRTLAEKVTRINETTRATLATTIRQGLNENLGPGDVARRIREKVPEMNVARSLTIARTEMSNAWNEGAVASFLESETVTHCSVIGCMKREADSPTYRGESTCNIQDVPKEDIDSLEFHINHTGTLVPSRFREEDGSVSTGDDKPKDLIDRAIDAVTGENPLPKDPGATVAEVEREIPQIIRNPAPKPTLSVPTVDKAVLKLKPKPELAKRALEAFTETSQSKAAEQVAEYVQKVETKMVAELKEANVFTRMSSANMAKVLETGRIKSQFETGTSAEMFNPKHRAVVEENLFGYPKNLPAHERPIYGYLSKVDTGNVHNTRGFGDVIIKLKPEVKQKATFCAGDSLVNHDHYGNDAVPAPVNAPLATALGKPTRRSGPWTEMRSIDEVNGVGRDSKFDSLYLEAQIHGGEVTLKMVEEVILEAHAGNKERDALLAALRAKGIKVKLL